MDALRSATMKVAGADAVDPTRARAERTATDFEQLFVRTIVSSLRQTAGAGGEGMFGKGPGADTFADWFDQNLAEQIGRDSDIGIASSLLTDMERHGQLDAENALQPARVAADRSFRTTTRALGQGGLDVVL
jgi:Rod binding domain-containing protein